MTASGPDPLAVAIRPAQERDVERLAALAVQLGYPVEAAGVARRLATLRPERGHTVYVAALPDGQVVGWVHVRLHEDLLDEPLAEIGGLVVDEACRGRRIGEQLMRQAEQWARERGCPGVYVRSNVIRTAAHRFYEHLGYRVIKTQLALGRRFDTKTEEGPS